jgi:hypothetical protein
MKSQIKERMETENHNSKKEHPEHFEIFVNRKKKTEVDGVTNPMSVDAIARLAGETEESATVQQLQGESGKAGPALSGSIEIKNGMHFAVTRKKVDGGAK